ncbi:MAG: hypothetical protein A2X77_03140 [Gammaproteobacteria bacterium GWE2_42_36]|nr:MAG: hypothetical protein A2X77_03140 [Gammaproteobacteria bacterium GWE2_42_36]HCU04832.1 hypothetical protein [Coxiellaceae bacterium]
MKKLFFLLPLTFLLSACATIMTGMHQIVTVKVIDKDTQATIENPKCIITSAYDNETTASGNPINAIAHTGYGHLEVNCVKEGYQPTVQNYNQSFNPWTIADVLLWPTFFVDFATGAVIRYPTDVTVTMNRK